eukprot:6179699-Pleurochrysis_carterae.AAC.5
MADTARAACAKASRATRRQREKPSTRRGWVQKATVLAKDQLYSPRLPQAACAMCAVRHKGCELRPYPIRRRNLHSVAWSSTRWTDEARDSAKSKSLCATGFQRAQSRSRVRAAILRTRRRRACPAGDTVRVLAAEVGEERREARRAVVTAQRTPQRPRDRHTHIQDSRRH